MHFYSNDYIIIDLKIKYIFVLSYFDSNHLYQLINSFYFFPRLHVYLPFTVITLSLSRARSLSL